MNNYGYTDYSAIGALAGGLIIFVLIIAFISLAVSIIQIIGLWKVFKKAGKGGWESIIPVYSNWVLVEISGLNWWWFLFFFAPLVLAFLGLAWLGSLAYLFAVFNCYYNISKKFNKGVGFAICLTIFTPICIPILGLSKDCVYDNNISVSNNGVFESSNNTNVNYNYQNANQTMDNNLENTQAQFSFCGNCGTKLDNNAIFCPNCGKKRI